MRTPYETCKLIESTIKEIDDEFGKYKQVRKKSLLLKTIKRISKKSEINEKCIIKIMGVYQ